MKKLLLALGILALVCSPAMAGRNANGAFVLHNDSSLNFSAGFDYCANIAIPTSCAQFNTTVTKDPGVETIIWMVAAFLDTASPAVTAWQAGLYGDLTADYYTAWAPCGPNPLEIPDATWPGTGTGTAVAFGAPVTSRLFKVYWFACGAPGIGSSLSTGPYPHGDGQAEFADDSNPPVIDYVHNFGRVVWGGQGLNQCPQAPQTGACCFADGHCQDLLQDQCIAQGGTFEGNGTSCATFQCPQPPQACCFADGSCQDLPTSDCTRLGGTPQGVGSRCATVQCPQPTVACCFADGSCQDLTEAECAAAGGTPEGQGTSCATFNCPPPPPPQGACCFQDGSCRVTTQDDCTASGGQYQGDDTNCDTVNCGGVPVAPSTWGKIKAGYR